MKGQHFISISACIMAGKPELREIFRRFPEVADRLEEWEAKVSRASRRGVSTFMAADKLPGRDDRRSNIRAVVEWTKTARGGRQFDLLGAIEHDEFEEEPGRCVSRYSVCE